MREVNLSKFDIRTDLVSDLINENNNLLKTKYKDIKISNTELTLKQQKKYKKPKGYYSTIYYKDVTDSTNYNNLLNVLTEELKKVLLKTKIKKKDSCLIIGLGNEKIIADCLGVLVAKKVIITKHIKTLIGSLEKGYRVTSLFIPGVMGDTGIETSDVVSAIIKKTKPDFIVVIDSLCSLSLDKLLKTIQITNTGISPGSGIGNNRKEITQKKYNIPVIAIGVPTVIPIASIVSNSLKYLEEYFKNKNSTNLFGIFEDLTEEEIESLINEVISPIGNNLIVTPKDIDFTILKLTNLISEAINKSLHNISTK